MDKLLGFAVDSAVRLDGQAMRATGAMAAGRYLSKGWKGIRPAECHDIKSHGLSLFFMWEFDGRMHGRQASADAAWDAQDELNRLGYRDAPVYFNFCDFDVSDSQLPLVGECFDGVRIRFPLERIGAYGGHNVIQFLFNTNRIKYGHQVHNRWGGGGVDERASLYQDKWNVPMGGFNVDVNSVYGTKSFV